MKKTFLISIFTIQSLILHGNAIHNYPDHLVPVTSFLDRIVFHDLDILKVQKEKLLKDFPYWSPAKFYCLPSFDGAYAFAIEEREDLTLNLNLDENFKRQETEYYLITNQLDRSFTEFRQTGFIEGKNRRRKISKQLAEIIGDIWAETLNETCFPDNSEYVSDADDGSTYYFSANARWGLMSGVARSPIPEVQPNLSGLVKKADIIFRFAQDEKKTEQDLINELELVSNKTTGDNS